DLFPFDMIACALPTKLKQTACHRMRLSRMLEFEASPAGLAEQLARALLESPRSLELHVPPFVHRGSPRVPGPPPSAARFRRGLHRRGAPRGRLSQRYRSAALRGDGTDLHR